MILRFLANACCTYEHDGYKLIADPWLVPGAFGTWTHDPPLRIRPEAEADADALYISHIHEDHLDPKTLAYFPRDVPIVTLKDRLNLCGRKLAELGFTNVTLLADHESAHMGPFRVTMFAPFVKHPYYAADCEIGNVVDSALLVRQGDETVLNTNDNAFDAPSARAWRERYGSPTVAQLGYNSAGPYPACFRHLSAEEKIAEGERIKRLHLVHLSRVADALRCEYVMPFAGAYKLGFGQEHLNPYLGLSSHGDAIEHLRHDDFDVIDLRENEAVDLAEL